MTRCPPSFGCDATAPAFCAIATSALPPAGNDGPTHVKKRRYAPRFGGHPLPPAAFVFEVGATLATLIPAPCLGLCQRLAAHDIAKAIELATGGLWWGAFMAGLMWATMRLEPAPVAILL
jgi:hypothetical protein